MYQFFDTSQYQNEERTHLNFLQTKTFCKQKRHKMTNGDRRISIGNKFDPNSFMENSFQFKIAEENEIELFFSLIK